MSARGGGRPSLRFVSRTAVPCPPFHTDGLLRRKRQLPWNNRQPNSAGDPRFVRISSSGLNLLTPFGEREASCGRTWRGFDPRLPVPEIDCFAAAQTLTTSAIQGLIECNWLQAFFPRGFGIDPPRIAFSFFPANRFFFEMRTLDRRIRQAISGERHQTRKWGR